MKHRIVLLALAIAGALSLAPASVQAQCTGVPPANTVCAGPSSGGSGFPGFRSMVAADLPSTSALFVGGTTAGTATAYTLATTNPPSFTLQANVAVIATIHATNGASPTLSVGGTAAKPLVQRTSDALVALVGGELVPSQKYLFVYDGTDWELMTPVAPNVHVKTTSYAVQPADLNGDFFVYTASGQTLTLPAANSVPNNGRIQLFAQGGAMTIALASGTDIINAGSAGASLSIGSGTYTIITTDGSGHWYVPTSGAAGVSSVSNSDSTLTISPTTGSVVASLNLGHINTWTADQYFKSGAPWVDVKAFGAVGNGSTDDTTSIQNAINSIGGGLGGVVYFPPGVYCAKTGITVSTAAVQLIGAAGGSNTTVQISACAQDVTPVTLNAFTAGIRNIQVLGGGITSTHPALALGSSCTECLLENGRSQGGTNALKIQSGDHRIVNWHAESSYGAQLVWALGPGYYDLLKADQTWPVSTPSIGAAPSAWTNGHAYTTGTVVSNSGFYIQATNNCTSAGVAPTNQNYGVNITDNTCIWKLVAPTTYYSLNLDTGASVNVIHATDHTGPFTAGIYISNSLAGTAPQSTTITDSIVGQSATAGIWAHDGNGLMVKGTQIANCMVNGCSGIQLSNSWTGDVSLVGNLIFTNPVGINLAAGTNTVIADNSVFNSSSIGIAVQANVTKFEIVGNNVGTSAVWGANTVGIQVLAGTSDDYTITNNETFGAGTEVTDGGSGTHKLVFGNGTSVLLAMANGGANNALTASNGGIVWSDASKLNILAGTATANLPLLSGATATPSWATISYPTSATSGGVPYFSSSSAMASSAALAAGDIVIGGGAGAAPATGTGCSIANSSITCLSSTAFFPQSKLLNTTADANSASFLFIKNRANGNTLTSDALLDFQAQGFANTAQRTSGRIQFIQTGASSGNNIPTKLILSTTDTGAQLDSTLTLDSASHVSNTQNTAPSLTAGCNGAGSSVSGTDLAGTVTGQTSAATSCTLTFGTAYASAPNCVATGLSSPLTGAVTPGTGTLVVNFTSTANFKWTYVCHGA